MTKEEILAMVAGGELDALVAERIFDHQISQRWCWSEPECGDWEEIESHGQKFLDRLLESHKGWGEELVKQLPCRCKNEKLDIWDVVPFYSTDISAAWQVVEKIRNLGRTIFLEVTRSYCNCIIEDESQGTYNREGTYPTRLSEVETGGSIPEAICKAALLAKAKQ